MKYYFSLIKFTHTVFALPFAAIGTVLAIKDGYSFSFLLGLKIFLCMLSSRSAAMAFNRWADADIDAKNPRTSTREIPSGLITRSGAMTFVIISCIVFIITCFSINKICFYLSPVALLIVLGYSYSKRYTSICHVILGLGLALSPIGAYLAMSGVFSLIPFVFSCIVLCWVSGFDIIYALQDVEFDQAHHLYSIPSTLGAKNGLLVSRVLHSICAALLIFIGYLMSQKYTDIGLLSWLAALFFIVMLVYQHLLVKENDLKNIDHAFFTLNGIASLCYGFVLIIDLLL